MDPAKWALVYGAVTIALLSWRVRHSWLWIGFGAMNFALTAGYEKFGFPMPPFFTAMCDAAMCLAIFRYAEQQWEIWLFRLFQGSVLAGIVYFVMAHVIGDTSGHLAYVIVLEIINWLALLTIGGTAVLERAGGHGSLAHALLGRRVSRAHRAVRAPREPLEKWWKVP